MFESEFQLKICYKHVRQCITNVAIKCARVIFMTVIMLLKNYQNKICRKNVRKCIFRRKFAIKKSKSEFLEQNLLKYV